jgi:hypothetical protein
MNAIVFLVLAMFSAQDKKSPEQMPVFPTADFRSPLDIPLTLAGNFGEPRRLHFHTGLDFRTNQMEGLNVYAVADGYVSRINVSGAGYGNALYITHTNGYTTVYGHLKEFSPKIKERLRAEQYKQESFAVDIILKKGELPVTQSEVVAKSGNTGGSGGPHLHFEVRDSLERPINPMLFGYNLLDRIKPTISYLKFYAQDEDRFKKEGYRVKAVGANGLYQLPGGTIRANAKRVSVSVNSWDGINGTANSMGIYCMKMYRDGEQIYQFKMDRVAFPDKRYVLSHVDYPIFMAEGSKSFHKCFVDPGNACPIYDHVEDRGIIDISDEKPHFITIESMDFAGNTSTVQFTLIYAEASVIFKPKILSYTDIFYPFKDNSFKNDEVKFDFKKGLLFDTLYFNYRKQPSIDNTTIASTHVLDKGSNLLMDFFPLSIQLTKEIPDDLKDKALIVYKDAAGGSAAKGGKLKGNTIETRARELGSYTVKIDTTPPRAVAVNVTPLKNMKPFGRLVFKIYDNLSGINDFDTYIDDQWVVTEHDAKTASLTHHLDAALAPGVHTFKIVLVDERKNRSEYKIDFRY